MRIAIKGKKKMMGQAPARYESLMKSNKSVYH